MAYVSNGIPVGRPKAKLDFTVFEQLCGLHCTIDEICAFMKIAEETLRARVEENYGENFSFVYKSYKDSGKPSLRRIQFALAKKNTAMAIWLGKQWLGQKDDKHLDKAELGNIVEAVLDIEERNRARSSSKSRMEVEQPLCNQECAGTEDKVCSELGTERDPIRPASTENCLKVPTDRNDDGVLHR